MKRHLFKVALFLLLGAIVNVAVAWGCTLILGENPNKGNLQIGFEQIDEDYKWLVHRGDKPGLISIQSYFGAIVTYGDEPLIEADSLVERWSHVPNRNDPSGEPNSWEEFASGWPVTALWSRLTERDPMHFIVMPKNPRVLPLDLIERGWLIDWSFLQKQYILPIGLIWHGFLINTIFYALILWLFKLGIFKMHRYVRSQHGCCIKCNYNLRGTEHDVCPECGTKIVKENMGDQARRKSALQVVMHAWYPGKRAVWWGILGFLISFIVYGFIAHRDIDYWDT